MNSIIKQDIETILEGNVHWEKLKDKTVFITGATGMMGQYMVNVLLELNKKYDYNIKILALCREEVRAEKLFGADNSKYITFIVQDVSNELKIDTKVDYIIHAASPANPIFYSTDPVGTIMANTLGTKNTLELAKRDNASYCYISTMEVYGKMENDFGIKEEDFGAINCLEPRSCYPESKRLGENMCVAYNTQYGIDVKIIRPAYTYGPGMSINDPRVQCEFMKKVLDNEDIVLKSDGTMKRTYTYVSDVVSGIYYAILEGKDIAYNVANEDAIISIRELAEKIIASYEGSNSKLTFEIKEEKGWSKVKPKVMNCDRLKSTGWVPKYSPDDGLKRTMEYHLSMKG